MALAKYTEEILESREERYTKYLDQRERERVKKAYTYRTSFYGKTLTFFGDYNDYQRRKNR